MKVFAICTVVALFLALSSSAQETPQPAKPAEHVLGTITKVDETAHTVTVKDDKSAIEVLVLVGETKTILKVPPGAKDLKTAQRITAADLQPGDRVDVRGSKPEDNPNAIAARSVVLMSARELAQAHQAEAAEWQHSTAGTVTSVDAGAGTIAITMRTPEGPQPATVTTTSATSFTRYSGSTPKTPVASQLADIQPGDQVRILGDKSGDGATIAAHKIYSGAFRTVAGTVSSVAPDGSQLVIKDLQTKQTVPVKLTADSVVRKLQPIMAAMLARRLNPDFKPPEAGAGSGTAGNVGGVAPHPSGGSAGAEGSGSGAASSGGGHWTPGGNNGAGPGGRMRPGTGDLSRILEHAPTINVSELKPGDAVVVSGAAEGAGTTGLIASNVIAGVEPIFQSAPPRQGRSLGDWSLDMSVPAQ